jgi:threonine synthase
MIKVIEDVYESTEYLLDPHTAIGVEAARQTRRRTDIPMICLSTAHPAKFPEAVRKAGQSEDPALPHHMADLFEREERFSVLEKDLPKVQNFIADNIRA